MLFAIAIVSPLWSWLEAINVQQEQQCPVKAIAVGMKDVVGPTSEPQTPISEYRRNPDVSAWESLNHGASSVAPVAIRPPCPKGVCGSLESRRSLSVAKI